eukprot:5430461-Lingulodinium_polyedra.AAC.1
MPHFSYALLRGSTKAAHCARQRTLDALVKEAGDASAAVRGDSNATVLRVDRPRLARDAPRRPESAETKKLR